MQHSPVTLAPSPAAPGVRRGFESLDLETTLGDLPVRGAIPTWVTGSLYRNGPARFEVGAERYVHWFDGLAMVHRFTIDGGRVSYGNRFLASPGARDAAARGRIACSEFGTKARRGPLDVLRGLGRDGASHNANVNLVPCGDELLALTETPKAIAFDPRTLETTDVRPFHDGIAGQVMTAHPHHDAARRRSINLVTEFGPVSAYHVVVRDDATGASRRVGSIKTMHPAYLHTFAVTQRYAIIAEFPLLLGNSLDLLFERRAFIENYRWQPERGTRFHAMRLDDGTVEHTWQGEAFFAFHHINAFDDPSGIVLDVSAYDDARIVGALRLDPLRAGEAPPAAEFRRYRLTFGSKDATFERLSTAATELPRVAPTRFARPYEYAYGIATAPGSTAVATEIVKVATADGTTTSWSRPETYPGEPVFVASPGSHREDDGIVLTVTLDGTTGRSSLVVLDATTLDEIASAELPHHVPFGFHGLFVRA